MDVVGYFYNFFSLEDTIQTVCGTLGREYPSHERIANVRVFINGKQPTHIELHGSCIAQWLPILHDYFCGICDEYFLDRYDFFSRPSIVHFMKDVVPRYEVDEERAALIDKDKKTFPPQVIIAFEPFDEKVSISDLDSFFKFIKLFFSFYRGGCA
jgi:hypothetical protein